MTLGVSNLSGTNSAFAGAGLSGDGAIAAQNFLNALLGQGGESQRTGGESFLADVNDAGSPEEKRALIDGFAAGFAAAAQGTGPDGAGADSAQPDQAGDTASPLGSAQTGAPADAQSGPSAARPQDLMNGFQEIADRVAESDLPASAKNALLDDIANLMSKLQSQAPASGSSAGTGTANTDGPLQTGGTSDPAGTAGTSETASSDAASSDVWSHEVKDGQATIRLGDKYTIKANEEDESWTVTNNETGKTMKVSGDPHVDANNDGKNDFDFKKDMTFKLDDGTKITVGTVPGGDNDATYSSTLTITNGANAMQLTGLGGEFDGKNNLEVTQSMQGSVVDQLANDGSNTIYENGGAWATGGGHTVDQAYIDRAEAMAG